MGLAAAASVLVLVLPGSGLAVTSADGALKLIFHYPMTCGQPGPGPVVVQLPRAFRLADVHATVNEIARPASSSGDTVTVTLPKPPQVTCMSITEGTLRVRIGGVHAAAGSYVVRAQIRSRAFAARLRIR